MFLEGKTTTGIARHLTKLKIPTPGGKDKWTTSTIKSILTNEKYKGDALLQKSYTVDFLTKKKKKNEGEVPQYYVENSHPAIISPEVFDMVQYEFEKRKGQVQSSASCFSSKIVCGDCGSFYGSKIWHSNDKYRKKIWICNGKYKSGSPQNVSFEGEKEQLCSDKHFSDRENRIAKDAATRRCNAKFKNKEKCKTPHITEEQIKKEFIKQVNEVIENKEQIIEDCERLILELTDITLIEEKEIKLQSERSVLYDLMKELIEQNSNSKMDQTEYNEQYEELRDKYGKVSKKASKLKYLKLEMQTKKHRAEEFIETLKQSSELLTDFDERLWYALIEKVTVNADGSMNFEFKNGKIIK